jgi:hypothetical protein
VFVSAPTCAATSAIDKDHLLVVGPACGFPPQTGVFASNCPEYPDSWPLFREPVTRRPCGPPMAPGCTA